ncbi:TPA: hypothetical protein F3P23_18845 [Aeromonas hydrophila]|uniref:DUF3226 domain-containing protein n=1 Tax=Aeromonas dhakensis TaxID=196024 RepID=UPI000ADA8F6B|nr:DUF3226 domain-containing protein [Aeromonas dhakensis]HAU4908820.1 hypothetical protein [Aeromonas hydrophila]HDZ8895835.1 hypothetical protein [Aeromonas dhakensis]
MITSDKIILVEGKDEIGFFTALCKQEELQQYQIIEVGGVDKFKDELPAIINDRNFDDVTSIAIIRDADSSVKAALQSIKAILENNGLSAPNNHSSIKTAGNRKVGLFIMPGNRDSGMLENLVLDSVSASPVKIQADQYIQNLKENLPPEEFPQNEHKARLHAYLSGMKKFVPSLGLATQKGYFDLNSEHFDELKKFLNDLK